MRSEIIFILIVAIAMIITVAAMFFKSRRKPKPQTPTHLVVEPLYMNETFIHWRERRQHLIPLHLIRMMDYFDLLLADERFHVVRIILKDGTAYCTIQQILFTKI